jgi:hypothetical protein
MRATPTDSTGCVDPDADAAGDNAGDVDDDEGAGADRRGASGFEQAIVVRTVRGTQARMRAIIRHHLICYVNPIWMPPRGLSDWTVDAPCCSISEHQATTCMHVTISNM